MVVIAAEREFVAGQVVGFEVGGGRQPCPRWSEYCVRRSVRARQCTVEQLVGDPAEILGNLGVVVSGSDAQRETRRQERIDVQLRPSDARIAGIADLGKAVRTEEGELDVGPVELIGSGVEDRKSTRLNSSH